MDKLLKDDRIDVEMRILLALWKKPVTLREVAEVTGTSLSWASRVLTRLIARGLVTKNNKSKTYTLTEKGVEVIKDFIKTINVLCFV
jgi:DNA-binding IclR family transcriptional regulator